MFAAGGNAVDASLAAAAVLTVVYPHQCALGGDMFALFDNGAGDVAALNGSGALPAAVDVAQIRAAYEQIPDSGPHSITVPGMVAAWQVLSSMGATLPWSDLLAPAIAMAEHGSPVAPSLAAGIRYRLPDMDEGMRAVFLRDGKPLDVSSTLHQPALAATLSRLATDGLECFYRGTLAERLVAGLRKAGCVMELADLQGHETEVTRPLRYDYLGHELLTCPPNSQGFVLFETLAALEALDIRLDALGSGAEALLHASLLAAADRDALLGDPRCSKLPLEELLTGEALAPRMEARMEGEPVPPFALAPAHGDTVAICAMDNEGRAVSLIQSVFQTFGSGVLEPDTGVIFHNRARGFSLTRGAPNELLPGTRPAHSLMPLLVRRGGTSVLSMGTMGGKAQPQILAQLLAGSIDPECRLTDVLARPRWVVGARDINFASPTVAIEADAPASLDSCLQISGLDVARIPSCSESVGHAQLIRRHSNGGFEGASDPRSDGSCAVYAG
jgi:gamma-glutamyltranspeptidase/glutathione hydrolase